LKIRTKAVAVGLGAALVLPASALAAKPKTVYMGIPPQSASQFNDQGVDINAFFPRAITVKQGGSVKFLPVGFHNLDLAPKGGSALPLLGPNGDKATDVKDAAGQPFWFNGQDILAFNPALLASNFGKKLSYSGTKRVNSGLPLANKPKPVTVKFTKKGSFTYYCDIHPGMKASVKVVGRKAKAPSAKSDAKVVKNQLKAAAKIAGGLAKKTPPASTVDVGSAGTGGVEYYGFVPGTVNVKVGDTVNFRMTKGSFEDHTASTGPGNPGAPDGDPNSYLGQIAASFQGAPAIDPRGAYPSDQPGSSAATLTPQLHGNGFWNSGVLDTSAATPLASSNNVKFGAAGTYTFYCLIHPFMKATVNVQ
jgi:plastocyanin